MGIRDLTSAMRYSTIVELSVSVGRYAYICRSIISPQIMNVDINDIIYPFLLWYFNAQVLNLVGKSLCVIFRS